MDPGGEIGWHSFSMSYNMACMLDEEGQPRMYGDPLRIAENIKKILVTSLESSECIRGTGINKQL